MLMHLPVIEEPISTHEILHVAVTSVDVPHESHVDCGGFARMTLRCLTGRDVHDQIDSSRKPTYIEVAFFR